MYPYEKIDDDISMYVLMELSPVEGIEFGYVLGKSTDKGIERGQRNSFETISDDQIKNIVSPKEALLNAEEWWSALVDYNGREKFPARNFKNYFIKILQDKDKIDHFIEDSAKQIKDLLNKPSA